MAQSNGQDQAETTERVASAAHSTFTVFKIGGKDIKVPALTLSTLELRDPDMNALGPTQTAREYANTVLFIIATSIEADKAGEEADPTEEAINTTLQRFRRSITFGEMRELGRSMDQLLLNSGFSQMGEALAAADTTNPGTGTLIESSPTSQSEESVEDTPKESSVH